jgi:hypothetical protein
MTPKSLLTSLCAASLITGAGLGVVADRALLAHTAPRPQSRFVEKITDGLDLSPTQREQVLAVFEKRRPQFLEIMKEVQPKVLVFREATNAELKAILRPEQQQRLEQLEKEWDKEHEPATPAKPASPQGSATGAPGA